MTVTNSANFSPTFSLYSVATDQVQTNDGTVLPAALDTHDHTSGKGIGAGRLASGVVGALPAVAAGAVYVATDQSLLRYSDAAAYHIVGALDVAQEWTAVQTLDSPVLATPTITGAPLGIPGRLAISNVNVGVDQSIDFSGLSASYSALLILGTIRFSNAINSDVLGFRFNGDAGANYDYQDNDVGWNTATVTGATAGRVGFAPGASDTAGACLSFKLFVPFYAGTSLWKGYTCEAYHHEPSPSSNYTVVGGMWHSTAAINRVTFLVGTRTYAAGSTIVVYGLN